MKKKSNNIFIRIFSSIGRFFDKILITPLTKLFFKFGEWINDGGRFFDKMSGNKSFLLIISLILAFSTFIVIDKENDVTIDQYAEILYQQPVTAIYNEELYVVEGLPDAVDITLVGQKRHIFLAKQSPSNGVTVDLTGLKPGQHKVKLKYSQPLKSLDYKLDPSEVTITIYKKVSTTKSLTYDILHQDELDSKLYIDRVTLDRSEVIVKGSQESLDKVATVKALVDVNDIPAGSVGEVTLKDVPLVAYDANGKVISVEIVPKTITCKLGITSPSKEVPIKIIPKGTVSLGKSIKSIESNISKVTVYGSEAAVDKLEQLEVEIDVDKLSKDKTFNITLNAPNGITELSETQITVKVTLDSSESKTIEGVRIIPENLPAGMTAQAASEADSTVTVKVTGSSEAIQRVNVDNVKAYVDLSNAKPGTSEYTVKVTGDDFTLAYEVTSNKKVSITVTG